ncbi:hypothetical protein [Thalassomonas haliotis]|uniref:Uncharacterized protein n=1 Tax=Thalassomonas haliotis TaxID=485448 RepID=A0ABY7VLR8_9GAMM|nr:hypothetical protein [Thalassomonas haliotis]WDE14218.1 hypothetical protein H3N35_12850 [Thalassomonas haliotis]
MQQIVFQAFVLFRIDTRYQVFNNFTIMKIFYFTVSSLLIAAIWLFAPYIEGKYVRQGGLTTIEAEYFTVTGDPLCTKLYRVEKGKITDHGVFPNMPADIPDPHTVSELKEGDRLLLTGYLYQWQETNLLTGTISKRKVNMIDVIRWQQSNRLIYKTQQREFAASAFSQKNDTDCRR